MADEGAAPRPGVQRELEAAAWDAAERAAADWVAGRYTPRWIKALAGAAMPEPGPEAPPGSGSV